jgi:1,4-alpha-glucan branching enzyme
MTPGDIDAISGGYHGDPFAVLGPHESVVKPGAWEVRAFLPEAEWVEVLMEGSAAAMERVHPSGFWAARIDWNPGVYRLRMQVAGEERIVEDPYRFGPMLSEDDVYLHAQGALYEAWRSMGAHVIDVAGIRGVRFAVWAPNAESVGVAGDFNSWDARRHLMRRRNGGIWEIFIPGLGEGALYKYAVKPRGFHPAVLKSDPYGFYAEVPPRQASIVWSGGGYQWQDAEWMERRAQTQWLERPFSVYEVHLESWMKKPGGGMLTYRELASKLVQYVVEMGFTHIELMPPMEHPYAGSWGYQVVGYFAPTSRFGTPDDFCFFIDSCHQHGIGVIVDWVPAHFPKDLHGLARFDGTACYEHEDPRQGEHKDWGTLIFNFGRNEVRNFLVSNALFWLKEYHIDGLRVDAVASILYLDYSRKEGEWIPNKYGGRENIEAIEFLRIFNEQAHKVPGALTIAEESTSFPMVSRPVYLGGLGFTMKWNMGWMHDMFHYFKCDPVFRKFHHNDITFSLLYAFNENFLLPISHDEVVHGKASLIAKMPGDEWQRFANVRAFLGYMFGHPGKKLLFMGCELGQYEEWNWQGSVRWDLLQYPLHRALHEYVKALNRLYCSEPALWEVDYNWRGFEWVDFHDIDGSVISFIRRAKNEDNWLLFVCSFTPVVRSGYKVGVPRPGVYEEIFNSDAEEFGGAGWLNPGRIHTREGVVQNQYHYLTLTLPPLGVAVFRHVGWPAEGG